jgi:outer membrane protein insertion porin family
MNIRRYLFSLVIGLICSTDVWADFVVKQIRIEGLQSLSQGTVLNYTPIRVGETFNSAKADTIIQTLYSTGLFENVSLGQSDDTLIIHIVESPVIGNVQINGNNAISKDDMSKLTKDANLIAGNVYSQAAMEQVRVTLLERYASLGYYNARVDIKSQHETRNRVTVIVNIEQGGLAKITDIIITGNCAFSRRTLLRQFILAPTWFLSFVTRSDRYSKEKLDASLEAVKSYYMDHGYIRFKVNSANATLSEDKRKVVITVDITEGPQYVFSGYKFTGNLIISEPELREKITFMPGEVFSRRKLEESVQRINLALGDYGYSYARIEPITAIDDATRQVFIDFHIEPGIKVYVRRITFKGNAFTGDNVMRSAMQQMEGSLLKTGQVQESVRKLNLLGFFKGVDVKTTPVPGTNNQVDLEYEVAETPSGQASVSVGYGSAGWEAGAGINEPNFLGTGRAVGLNFNRTAYSTNYSMNYYNPYYTVNNIGRGWTAYYSKFTPGHFFLTQSYSYDSYGANIFYNIPIALNDNVQAGYGYKRIDLSVASPSNSNVIPPSIQVRDFVKQYGQIYNIPILNFGWNHVGQDRGVFPTKGLNTGISAEVTAPLLNTHTLNYYKVGYTADYYQPLNRTRSFILQFNGGVGYGNGFQRTDGLPFLFNYYAGGLSQGLVRGYKTNSLGPIDSNYQSVGANFLLHGTINFIFPNMVTDSVRTSIFVDAGNVYQTSNDITLAQSFRNSPLRYSAGIALTWRSPLGPLSFSLAQPLNYQEIDRKLQRKEIFQFTMGTSF